MNDIFLSWGGDVGIGSTGDLALVGGSELTQQRVERRLLTNPGDYIWQLDYGGGLGQFVGTPAQPADIEAVVRAQLALETAVSTTPAPRVSASVVDTANGYVVANITYVEASSEASSQLVVSAG
jgi:phage baseplate assembly protein W